MLSARNCQKNVLSQPRVPARTHRSMQSIAPCNVGRKYGRKEIRTTRVTVLENVVNLWKRQFTSETATKGNQVMRFIGADLHKKSITFCVVEVVSGKTIVHQRMRIFCCETDRIAEFLASHAPYQLVVEASIGYEWFASLAENTADRVVLAHAGRCLRTASPGSLLSQKIYSCASPGWSPVRCGIRSTPSQCSGIVWLVSDAIVE